ncbi:MAG: DivIVA domain-containing protein [Acidimicrobiales bacterium]
MEVASRSIREVEFRQQLRGYNQDDVDEFLERVAAGIEVLQERLREATERAARAEQRLAEQRPAERPPPAPASAGGGSAGGPSATAGGRPAEVIDDDAVRRTLVLAQRTADMAVKEAKEEAAHLLAEAEDEVRRRRAEGERELRNDVARLTTSRAELAGQVAGLEDYLDSERRRVKESLGRALEWLEANLAKPAEVPMAVGLAETEAVPVADLDLTEALPSPPQGRPEQPAAGQVGHGEQSASQPSSGQPTAVPPRPAPPRPEGFSGQAGNQPGREAQPDRGPFGGPVGPRPGGAGPRSGQGPGQGSGQAEDGDDPAATQVLRLPPDESGGTLYDIEEAEADRSGSSGSGRSSGS